jgi:hypothetical protein
MAPLVGGYCKTWKTSIFSYTLVFMDLVVGLAWCIYFPLFYLKFCVFMTFHNFIVNFCYLPLTNPELGCTYSIVTTTKVAKHSRLGLSNELLKTRCLLPFHLKMEILVEPVSKILFSLQYQTMVEVRKLSNPKHIKFSSFTEQIQTYSPFCELYNIYRNIWQVLLFLNKSIL